jgi:hypothetical protein
VRDWSLSFEPLAKLGQTFKIRIWYEDAPILEADELGIVSPTLVVDDLQFVRQQGPIIQREKDAVVKDKAACVPNGAMSLLVVLFVFAVMPPAANFAAGRVYRVTWNVVRFLWRCFPTTAGQYGQDKESPNRFRGKAAHVWLPMSISGELGREREQSVH